MINTWLKVLWKFGIFQTDDIHFIPLSEGRWQKRSATLSLQYLPLEFRMADLLQMRLVIQQMVFHPLHPVIPV
ncbi:MAG: hypothetical protein EBR73_01405 [Rhodobacteraceae bacterium]|nr:hypothetical protein [Paracoccaceae bacterium]